MNKVVYIAGPITGDPDYKVKFEAAAKEIEAMGFAPYSPTWQPSGLEYEQYIDMGLQMLMKCDAAVFLNGCGKSAGAHLEADYCTITGKPIVFYHDQEWGRELKKVLDNA